MTDFSDQFQKILMRYNRIGYNLKVLRHSACLVINPITNDGFAALFNCTPVDRASDPMMGRPKAIHFNGWDQSFTIARSIGAQLIIFSCPRFPVVLFDRPGISISVMQHVVSVQPSSLLLHSN